MKKLTIAIAFAAAMISTNASAGSLDQGAGSAEYRIAISGHVPVICRVQVDETMVAPSTGTVSLGTLKEFCNNANGFRVVADYSPALAGASLIVDGRTIALGQSGSVIVAESNQPANLTVPVELALAEGGQSGNLQFRIEPR